MSSIKMMRAAKAGYMVLAALFCIMGGTMLFCPGLTLDMISWGVGVIFAAFGIIRIIGFYSRDPYALVFQYDPVMGVVAIALGAVLMLHRNLAVNVLGLVLGVEIIADNLFKIQTALDARRFGLHTWWLMLLLAVIAVIAGALLLLCPFEGIRVWVQVMGFSLVSQGVISFCMALCAIRIPPRRMTDVIA